MNDKQEVDMKLYEFASQLASIYEENLASVILYGSAADGEFQKGYSDYNIIIVLKNLTLVEIAKSNGVVKKWIKAGNSLPLFFSRQIIGEAADVFPIEFFDIKERHKVLYGDNPFKEIEIDLKNLRHQCEHELRSKLLSLRSRLAALADNKKELLKLILESSSSFFAIFGGVARLADLKPDASKNALLKQLETRTGSNLSIFSEILELRNRTRAWKKEDVPEKFEQYLTSIEAVVKYVNTVNKGV